MKTNRRGFIKMGALASGGLLLGIHFSCKEKTIEKLVPGVMHPFNAYLEIDKQGIVKIYNPVPEIGQGVKTALPMLVAEELNIDWTKVIVEQAPAGERFGGYDQRAAGSNSVRIYWEPMRKAGAFARDLLLTAAATQWGLKTGQCTTKNGWVHNTVNRKKISFGELAEYASTLDLSEEPKLKDPRDFQIIGKSAPNPGISDILRGKCTFGQDVRIPGMAYASMEKNDVYGATVKSFDASEAMRIPGVIKVFKVPFHGNIDRPFCREGIAVIGETMWAVLQGRKALQVEWELGSNQQESTADLHKLCENFVSVKGESIVKSDGDVYSEMESSTNGHEAVYHLPFIAHIPMETVNCTIDLKEDSCTIWSTSQVPFADLNFLARFFDLPLEKIDLRVTRIGGGFGRRLGPDYTIEAAKIAKELKRPVQFVWTREDDIKYDAYRPFSYHKLAASWDKKGKITSWLHRQAGTSRYAFRAEREPHESEFFPNNFPANLIGNYQLEYTLAPSNINRSLIRAPGNNSLAFAVESFMDELAHATKRDPLEFRLDILGKRNQSFEFDPEEKTEINTDRMRGVLELAAQKADWGKERPRRSGMGIAGYFTFNTYVAHVAEVSVSDEGQLTIHKFTSAVDCGQVLHEDGVKAQVEGAIMDGLSAALYQEITVENGAVRESNFSDYQVLRHGNAPRDIEVHIIKNSFSPTGMGEPPYPPVAPALCNAIFAATGKRIRKLPIGNQIKFT